MNSSRDPKTDEYFVTAHQIFECCGVENSSTLHVDALMDKFAPFVKTNKTEFSFLKSFLDPEQCNPEINVSKLANALHQYSESQKNKMDLDESFNNLRCGQALQDSDSGISTDGLQLLEELQCELKEKEHLAHDLRNQLDITDRQHEETIAALTAERDSLRRHLNMVREENASLCHVRRDYEEACERLCGTATALEDATRELEGAKRRARLAGEQLATLEGDKVSLQELLSKSRDECHRINEMYAARQSALLEQNETLKSEHADLAARLQDQDEFMQQVVKEKVLLEMELKDLLNKSNQTHLRLDRSIDVSYTEDQMLSALDSLNADSRFSTENRILDEDSFMNALRDDPGRSTNMSLFDEIRMSFSISRLNLTEYNADNFIESDNSILTTATQTDEIITYVDTDKNDNRLINTCAQTQTGEGKIRPCIDCDKGENGLPKTNTATQTDKDDIRPCIHCPVRSLYCDKDDILIKACAETQTENQPYCDLDKMKVAMVDIEMQTDCNNVIVKIQKTDLGMQTESTNEKEIYYGGDNAQNYINSVNVARKLDFATSIEDESCCIENKAQHTDYAKVTLKANMETQTDSLMLNELSVSENNVQFHDAIDYTDIATQTVGEFIRKPPKFIKAAQKLLKLKHKQDMYRTTETQTDEIEPCIDNNNAYCVKCLECDNMNKYTQKLERDVTYANMVMKEMETKIEEYENDLTCLETLIGRRTDANKELQSLVDDLRSKIEVLGSACETQRDAINKIVSADTCCKPSQTELDQTSVSTQACAPCPECEKRAVPVPHRGLRRFFWEPLKCLFQIFAVICFLGAVSLLYGVSQRGRARCERERGVTPWRWFDAQDVMDLLLRIEYTAEVPM